MTKMKNRDEQFVAWKNVIWLKKFAMGTKNWYRLCRCEKNKCLSYANSGNINRHRVLTWMLQIAN